MIAALDQARDRVSVWKQDPVAFVRDMWGAEPTEWQAKILTDLVRQTAPKRAIAFEARQVALGVWWFLATHYDAQVVVMLPTHQQSELVWRELGMLHQESPLLLDAFGVSSRKISEVQRPHTWWASNRPSSTDAAHEHLCGFGFGPSNMVVCAQLEEYPRPEIFDRFMHDPIDRVFEVAL